MLRCPISNASPVLQDSSPLHQSRVLINLGPCSLSLRPLKLRLLPVRLGAIESLGPQTLVDLSLCFIAIADGGIEETAGVAFVECVHDRFAACLRVSMVGWYWERIFWGGSLTGIVFGVEGWMHCDKAFFPCTSSSSIMLFPKRLCKQRPSEVVER